MANLEKSKGVLALGARENVEVEKCTCIWSQANGEVKRKPVTDSQSVMSVGECVFDVKSQWEKMQLQSPQEAQAAREKFIMPQRKTGSRDWGGLQKLITKWVRKTQVSLKSRMVEVDWRKFKRNHKKLGYTKPTIKNKWARATGPEAFKAGKARRQGKKILVWFSKGREIDNADIIELKQSGEEDVSYVGREQAKAMLRGKQGLQLSDTAKAETFGGEA